MAEQAQAAPAQAAAERSTGSRILWVVLAFIPLAMPGAAYLMGMWPYDIVWVAWAFIFLMSALFTVVLIVAYPARVMTSKGDRTARSREALLFLACVLGAYWIYANAWPFDPARAKLFTVWEDELSAFAKSVQPPESIEGVTQIPVGDGINQIAAGALILPDLNADMNIAVVVNGGSPLKQWVFVYLPNKTTDVPGVVMERWPNVRAMNEYWLEASN